MNEANRQSRNEVAVAFLLITVGVVMRMVSNAHEFWNFAPVTATALFAGYYFRRPWVAALVPLAVILISNGLLDQPYGHAGLAVVTCAALVLPVVLRGVVRRRPRPLTIGACAVLSSVAFFLVTNFAVWAFGFARPGAGLLGCYLDGVPFFRYTLVGDLTWTAIFFGGFAAANRLALRSPAGTRERAKASLRV